MPTTSMRVLSQGEIEAMIGGLCDEMADETERYAVIEEMAAEAEADYKLQFAQCLIRVADSVSDRRTSAGEREALADSQSGEKFKIWKIQDARRRASKEALLSLRARLDAMRTLSANVRNQT